MNQDGQITTRDYVIWYNQKSLSSEGGLWYLDGDLNLDGVVDDQDFQIWQQNSRIPEPENTQ
jgi:stress response protein SCP2